MKNLLAKRFIVTAGIMICLLVLSILSTADVGNFNDYSDNSSSDYSSSSYSDSSSSSYSGSYSSSSYDSSSSSTSLDGSTTTLVILLVVGILIYQYIKKNNKSNGNGESRSNASQRTMIPTPTDQTGAITSAIRAIDPDFSAEQFLAFCKETYITLQQAWSERDWEKVRLFEKDTLYKQHAAQLQEYIDKGRINIIERINIHQAYLHKYVRDDALEHLTVFMRVRMIDYIIDEATKKVLKGNPDVDCHLQYLVTFERKKGMKTTSASAQAQTIACPHCGAPTQITSSGKCEFCDFIISTKDYNWVLADISGVGPSTAIDNSGVIIRES